jgi:hypothetical protein
MSLNLYVMDRGFVLVGEPQEGLHDGLYWTLKRCGVVRRWGTKSGLGELAAKGPRPETVIDVEPDGVLISRLHTFRIIPCAEKGWSKWNC